jgi:hypothetical protein
VGQVGHDSIDDAVQVHEVAEATENRFTNGFASEGLTNCRENEYSTETMPAGCRNRPPSVTRLNSLNVCPGPFVESNKGAR